MMDSADRNGDSSVALGQSWNGAYYCVAEVAGGLSFAEQVPLPCSTQPRILGVATGSEIVSGWIHQELNRSRTYDSWTFPPSSSGPFGDDLPGRWLNYDEMKATYECGYRLAFRFPLPCG